MNVQKKKQKKNSQFFIFYFPCFHWHGVQVLAQPVSVEQMVSCCMLPGLVGGHGVAVPGVVVADFGINSGLVLQGTAITPGYHSLQLTIAHQSHPDTQRKQAKFE